MEVHHSHNANHKKKWTEYLLEFVMLFLAVFLGFIAENIRENVVERHHEKEYIESLVLDLRTDTANLSEVIASYKNQIKKQDSLLQMFDTIRNGYNKNFIGLIISVMGYRDFVYSDATIQELKNSGFRLIKNKNAVDSINAYTSEVRRAFINTDDLDKLLGETDKARNDLINYHAILRAIKKGMTADQMQESKMDILISHNKEDQERFYNRILQFQTLMSVIADKNFSPLKQQAERLISFLQKEYHVGNK